MNHTQGKLLKELQEKLGATAPKPNPIAAPIPTIPTPSIQKEEKIIYKPKRVYSSFNPVASAMLLTEICNFLKRFLILESEEHFTALALWIVHTHTIEHTDFTPRLGITSPEKRCGKSLLLEVVAYLCPRPLRTGNLTPSVLFHVIAQSPLPPTIFMDEADATFGGKGNPEKSEALRQLANSGFKRGDYVLRMGGKAMDEVMEFSTFAALALAGIGSSAIPETVADRAIMIEMRRKQPGEDIEEFESDEVDQIFGPLRAEIEVMAESRGHELRKIKVAKIPQLNPRARDKWKALLRIATLAGPDWLEMARLAAIALEGGEEDLEEQSEKLRLLSDARGVFKVAQMSSKDLLLALMEDEEGEWRFRPFFNQNVIARMLKQYGIRTRALSTGIERGKRGYFLADFQDAWKRYLPALPTP